MCILDSTDKLTLSTTVLIIIINKDMNFNRIPQNFASFSRLRN